MGRLKVKVCGMRDSDNIASVAALCPDYMGFIWVERSPRYVGENFDPSLIARLPTGTTAVGVFCDCPLDALLSTITRYKLKAVQLHGAESPDYCASLAKVAGALEIIKSFGIDQHFNAQQLENYRDLVSAFLFDTKCATGGGSGTQFNWSLLRTIKSPVPFFLSGGIGPGMAPEIGALHAESPCLIGVDINSRFEDSPGRKNVARISGFMKELP